MHQYRESFEASAGSGRQAWIAPTVNRLEAGAAEAGPNPIRPEGLAMGS
jgi:hypothetical protein